MLRWTGLQHEAYKDERLLSANCAIIAIRDTFRNPGLKRAKDRMKKIRNLQMASLILVLGLTGTGCETLGPMTVPDVAAPEVKKAVGGPGASSELKTPAQANTGLINTYNKQAHPIEIFIEEDLARFATDEEIKNGNIDWWLDTGNDKRYVKFNNPFTSMQWDIVNLRLKDRKETPIKLGTKLDSRFDKIERTLKDSESVGEALSTIAPMFNNISYGGGRMASMAPQFSDVADSIQRIEAYAKERTKVANNTARDIYISKINDMFMEEGFPVIPIHAEGSEMLIEKPDYIVEEVWATTSNGPIAETFRIFSGEGQLLYKIPYHRSHAAISLFLKAKMTKGELSLKSEKYTALTEAVNLWEAEQDEEALAGFQNALEIDPKFVNGYRYRAKFFAAKNRWKEAIEDLDQAMKYLRVKERPFLYYERGRFHWENNNPDAALKDFDKVLKSNPRSAPAKANRGFCWLEKNNLKKALQDFEDAEAIDPQCDIAMAGKGWVLALDGQYEEALREFNRALAITPNLSCALRGRGYSYKMLGQKTQAREDFVAALQQMAESHTPMTEKKRFNIQSWIKEMDTEVPIATPPGEYSATAEDK